MVPYHGREHKNQAQVDQPLLDSPSEVSECDFTPKTPHTVTAGTSGLNSAANGSSPEFDISSFTNGNMAEIMDDETLRVNREKAEFMYLFEGAMSVI